MKKIYVGNLPFSATEDEIKELFGQHGTVHSVALINDRETGRPRGFGFVEVDDEALSGDDPEPGRQGNGTDAPCA